MRIPNKSLLYLLMAIAALGWGLSAIVVHAAVPVTATGTLGADQWYIESDGDIIPDTDSALDIGASGSEVDNIYADSLWLGGVEITGASEISSPMADETGYVRTMDGGTKIRLYDVGYIQLGDGTTDSDYYLKLDGANDDWAVGIDTTTDDYTISLGGAFATDNRLAITDDTDNTIITIGDGATYDHYLVFDGVQDFYFGIDDTGGDAGEDTMVWGGGSAVNTTPALGIGTSGAVYTKIGLDCMGAADMDYGSADVTDHTFTTDSTGDAEIVLPNDSIGDDEIDWNGLTTSHGLIIGGATPTLTVGDGGTEDNWVFFNNSAATDDWSVGVDDTRDRFEIANGADLNQTCAISIDSSENVYIDTGDVTIADGSLTITIDETAGPTLWMENTYDDATCPIVKLENDRATEGDGDDLGRISFYGSDDGDAASEFAYILGEAADVSAGKESGSIEISLEIDDTDTSMVKMFGDTGTGTTGHIEFNQDAADIDFHIDGNTTADFFHIDATTEVLSIGKAAAYAGDNYLETATTPNFQVNETADDGGIAINTWTTTATEGGGLFINTADHATIGTHGALESGDDIGGIYFNASDGVGFQCAAAIMAEAEAQCSAGDTPGVLKFLTSADAGDTPAEHMRITSAGLVGIGSVVPLVKLDVTGAITASTGLKFQTSIFATGHFTGTSALASATTGIGSGSSLSYGIFTKNLTSVQAAGTLSDGTVGQMITIAAGTLDGSSVWTLTPVTTTGFTSIAFDAAIDTITLLFLDATRGWIVIGNAGCTIA